MSKWSLLLLAALPAVASAGVARELNRGTVQVRTACASPRPEEAQDAPCATGVWISVRTSDAGVDGFRIEGELRLPDGRTVPFDEYLPRRRGAATSDRVILPSLYLTVTDIVRIRVTPQRSDPPEEWWLY